MNFYKLEIPRFSQYKYAWAEPFDDSNISDYCDKCPKCKSPISMLHCNPPYKIVIKQPKKIGDFVNGIIPSDIVVSERFVKEYNKSDLKGIKDFFELTVAKVGSKGQKTYDGPKLFGAMIERPLTKIDHNKMGVKWSDKPQKGYCDLCGPGGGGAGGTLRSYERISIMETTWTGLDFFIPINFCGNIMITNKVKDFIESNKFENCKMTIDEKANNDYYKPN